MPRHDSPLRERVIFVVGARRSGTNWLERILTAHPEIVGVPTETYLFSHGVSALSALFQHANPNAPSVGRTFLPREAFLDATRDFVDRVLLENLERQGAGARYIVERTPWHASHLDVIAAVYPDARVLNIVRDGRAIARSLLAMQWGPQTIEEAAVEWRTAVEDATRGGAALGERFRDVGYEQAIAEPRARIGEIFEWLGLELTDATWARILTEAGAAFNNDPSSPGVRPDKWRDELSEDDIATIERVAGPQLLARGYALSSSRHDRPARAGAAPAVRSAWNAVRGRATAAARRQTRERTLVRRRHADQIAHKQTVLAFERLVAAGDDAQARDLLAPTLRLRRDGAHGPLQSRGPSAIDELLAALGEHRDRGMHILAGHVHESPYAFTTVLTYALADGTRWVRTAVYHARGGTVREVGLYCYELEDGAAAPTPGTPARAASDP